ncbi:MAG: lytic transglycosylase domain-containing protein [Deltaproteobacteria bacterium]|nr:lytic transglycosylase domain-containing protein [Deltaproteobacteria bacterium]
MKTPVFFAILFSVFALARAAEADFYSYTDSSGVVHLTNVPVSPDFHWTMREKGVVRHPMRVYSLDNFEEIITRGARRHGVDPALAKAVVKAESGFDANAVSDAGAKGLMQLMPETARLWGVSNVFNPEENVDGGMRYLKYLLKLFSYDVRLAVAAYNAGENAVIRYGAVPPFAETREYVRRVTRYRRIYKASAK